MSRRNPWKTKELAEKKEKGLAGPFTDALKQVDLLEERAIYSLVPIEFTAEDILTEVLDPEHLRLLRAVSTLAKDTYTNTRVILKLFDMSVMMDLDNYNVYPFKEETCRPISTSGAIATALTSIGDISKRYDTIQDVVKYFNRLGTIGAARYYWPSMCSLLPGEHEIHNVDGAKFKDIPGIGPMINKLRETSATVAGSLLLPEVETKRTKVILYYAGNNRTVGLI